jgi:anion-transporting  ArsA/GET3 family ATPase
MNDPIVIDTPKNIHVARMLIIRSGLKLELNTGMRHSRNLTFNAAKQITGQKSRQKCLDVINKMLAESGL